MQSPALLIITEDSPQSFSPAGERVRHMALAGKTIFARVLVLTLHGRGERRQQRAGVADPAVSYYSVNFNRAAPFPISGFFDPMKFLVLLAHGFLLGRRLKPSFIMVSMPPLEAGVSAWLLTRLLRSRLVTDLRDDWEAAVGSQLSRYIPLRLISLLAKLARRIYSSSVRIFAVTQSIVDVAHQRAKRVSTVLIPNGADTSVFKPRSFEARERTRLNYQLPLDRLVIVYCGSGINTYYRLDLVFSSMKMLPERVRNKVLLVSYVYNGFEYLKKLKNSMKIPDDLVEIRSPLSKRHLSAVLSAADVGLVPFDKGAYLLCARSTKLYEYLSSGLYVVSSGPQKGELDCLFSSNPDLGMFTDPSVEGYTRALVELAESPGNLLVDDLRAARHTFIREHYDRNTIMTKALQTLKPVPVQTAT